MLRKSSLYCLLLTIAPAAAFAGESRYLRISNGGQFGLTIKTEPQSDEWDLIGNGFQTNDLVFYSRKRQEIVVQRVAGDGTRTTLSRILGEPPTWDLMTSGNVIGTGRDLLMYDRTNGILRVYAFTAAGALDPNPIFNGAFGAANERHHWTQLATGSFHFNGSQSFFSIAAYAQATGIARVFDWNSASATFDMVFTLDLSTQQRWDRMISGNFDPANSIWTLCCGPRRTDELLFYNLDTGDGAVFDLRAMQPIQPRPIQEFSTGRASEQALLIAGTFDEDRSGDDLLILDKNARESSSRAEFWLQSAGILQHNTTRSWLQKWNLAVPIPQAGISTTDLWLYSYELDVPAVFLLVRDDNGNFPPLFGRPGTRPIARADADQWIDAVHRSYLSAGVNISWDREHRPDGGFYLVNDTLLNERICGSNNDAATVHSLKYADWFGNSACLTCVFALEADCRDTVWDASCVSLATGVCAPSCPLGSLVIPPPLNSCDPDPIEKIVFISTSGNSSTGVYGECSSRMGRYVLLPNFDQVPKLSVHGLGHYFGLQHSHGSDPTPSTIWDLDGADSNTVPCLETPPVHAPDANDTSPGPITGACDDAVPVSVNGLSFNPDRHQPMSYGNDCTYPDDPDLSMYRLTLDQIRHVRETIHFRRPELIH